jgi:[ribosomal protein S5]-alanine N-acetyltransferase
MASLALPREPTDGRVRLRRLEHCDVDAYVAAFVADPELGRLLGLESDPDEAVLRGRLERMDAAFESGRFVEVAIADGGSGEFLGSLTLHELDWKNRRGEVGFWIVPGARRRGVCESAVRLALRWMFDDLGFERVELTTTTDNAAVAALAPKLGFTREGTMRGRNLERGRRVDIVQFGLLRDDWAALSRAATAS